VPGHPYERGFDLRLVPEKLFEPLRWSLPKMVFVNSMSDLFHEAVPDEYIQAVATVMCESPWHIYQVLTKRSQRLNEVFSEHLVGVGDKANIWWGVSVENRKHGLARIADLQRTPAAVRFLSVEPLLEDLGEVNLQGIDWVIVGGESGPGSRAMESSWVLSLLKQCQEAEVPFFFKQWGGVRKKRNGRLLNDRTYDEFPAITRAGIPSRVERDQLSDRLAAQLASTRHAVNLR